jgi:hypothetical protein
VFCQIYGRTAFPYAIYHSAGKKSQVNFLFFVKKIAGERPPATVSGGVRGYEKNIAKLATWIGNLFLLACFQQNRNHFLSKYSHFHTTFYGKISLFYTTFLLKIVIFYTTFFL